MLANLHVKNIALIDEADVEFGRGLNILTGETGAGKSILLGSVNLALGKKANPGLVGKYGDYGLAELVFHIENKDLIRRLEDLEVFPEEGMVILSRKITESRSVCRINGETATLAKMKAVAEILIDIHGQHDHQSLLKKEKQLEILDSYGGKDHREAMANYREIYQMWKELRKELKESSMDEDQQAREIDFLQFEIQEIREAGLQVGEDDQLEQRFRFMANSRKIQEVLAMAESVAGSNSNGSAGEQISEISQQMARLEGIDESLDRLVGQIRDIESLLDDFHHDLEIYLEDSSFSPEEYDLVQDRLNEINRLKGKYGKDIGEIFAYCERQEAELDRLLHIEEKRAELIKKVEKVEQELEKVAKSLRARRKKLADGFAAALVDGLKDLNFLQADFEIVFKDLPEPGKSGRDQVEFLISTNPGEPRRPFSDVVSGGELSRTMLAIRTLLAEQDDTEVLIFDEIDTGISGITAGRVAEKMELLGRCRQIICITHLAQIAAAADQHFEITKEAKGAGTQTFIKKLNEEASIWEIARILGGSEITEAVKQSAREMKEKMKA